VELLHSSRPLSALDLEDHCPDHPYRKGRPTIPLAQRLWRIASQDDGIAPGSFAARLRTGTLLRLDLEEATGHRKGNFGPDGYWIVSRRFCVLDGPMTGSCWLAEGLVDMQDRTRPRADLVERVR
jgi:hypothetical protein